jgi:hypothetical protein
MILMDDSWLLYLVEQDRERRTSKGLREGLDVVDEARWPINVQLPFPPEEAHRLQ